MKERPILFSGPMVRAILVGRKTQTRRTVRARFEKQIPVTLDACPYGQPGDRLWVKETWYDDLPTEDGPARKRYEDGHVCGIEYRASHDCTNWEAGCPCNPDGDGKRSEWRPSIYMPRWASRITLEITGVRVERVQDISEDDARAEGIEQTHATRSGDGLAAQNFAMLWDTINGKRAPWSSNPWIWALSFRRV